MLLFFLFISMLTLGVHSSCNNTLIGSGFLPLIIDSLIPWRYWGLRTGRSGKGASWSPVPQKGWSDSDLLAWSVRVCLDYSTRIESLSSMYTHCLKRFKKKHLVYLHFHHSRRSRKTWNLATFLLRHHTMWNIAPLIHMPLQISWGTAPMTVVVNSMKTSHKTAESPW